MNALNFTKQLMKAQKRVLEAELETEFRKELTNLISGICLKDRNIRFDNAMGSATVDIDLRSGAFLSIASYDVFIVGIRQNPWHFRSVKWIRDIQELLRELETHFPEAYVPSFPLVVYEQ